MFFLLTAIVFLLISLSPYHYWDEYYYLFSVLHHSPGELLEFKTGVFPEGFFLGKIGFVIFLRYLVQIFGGGLWSLLVIQFIFATIVVAFVAASYGLLGEIFEEREARHVAVVLMFLPISVYLSYKVLSEMPSLLFVSLGCWVFLSSFQARSKWQLGRGLILSMVGLFIGVSFRLTSFLFFAGLVLGLLVLGDERYDWKEVLKRASLVASGCLVMLTVAWVTVMGGLPFERLAMLVISVTQRSPSLGVKIYSLAMSVQFFLAALIFGLRPPWDRKTRLALVWMGVCTLPFVIGAKYVEPRYFYMGLVPLAILIHSGVKRVAGTLHLVRYRLGPAFLVSALVLGNWWFLSPLMPYEIDQHEYSKTMTELTPRYQQATYLTPWLSDYSFLRFAFPERNVKLSLSRTRDSGKEVLQTDGFKRWAGETGYIGSLESLTRLSEPWVYVGWKYNPTIGQLKKRLDWLGIDYLKNIEQREKVRNHLALSWIWSHPALALRQVIQVGPYHAFEIRMDNRSLFLRTKLKAPFR